MGENVSRCHSEASDVQILVVREIEESIAVKKELAGRFAVQIAEAGSVVVDRLRLGGTLIVFGNGGSAADAQHIAAELVGRYRAARKALAAIALTTNTSSLTAIGNDYGFEEIFSRQIEAIANPRDVTLAISTSGNSPNVLRGLETARRLGVFTIGLAGRTGGKMRSLVDLCLCAPSDSTPRIQEAHILIGHILSGIVEDAFLVEAHTTRTMESTGTARK